MLLDVIQIHAYIIMWDQRGTRIRHTTNDKIDGYSASFVKRLNQGITLQTSKVLEHKQLRMTDHGMSS